jgi:hypothetical protein
VYYDVENVKDPINIVINLTHNNLFRMWEIKVSLLTNLFTISPTITYNQPVYLDMLKEFCRHVQE